MYKEYSVDILIVLYFLGWGFALFYYYIKNIYPGSKSYGWPKVKGKIINYSVDTFKRIMITAAWYSSHKINIKYKYIIKDQPYISDKIKYGLIEETETEGKYTFNKLLEKYPKGKHIDVYYNPINPKIATLEKGCDWKIFFVFCLLFLLQLSYLIG